jgi:hypothetical protein
MILKDLRATEQHFACHPKWRYAVWSIAYTTRGIFYPHIFMKLYFGYMHKILPLEFQGFYDMDRR